MKRSLSPALLVTALLASPLALAVGTGTTYPDDPHAGAPEPGVDSTLNPIQKPMPRDTDPRPQGNDPESPPARPGDNDNLPGMDGTGSEGTGMQGGGGTTGSQP